MKKLITTKEQKPQFIIINDLDQVFCGLKSGYPDFTEDWKSAKPLNNQQQFDCIQRGTIRKLEILYI